MNNRSIPLLAALLLAAAGCSPKVGGKPDVPAGTPVILISIDTLRADRLPVYGYQGVETPAIQALREDSILYERAYTVTPLTLPAHSSLLTGVLPAEHTVRDNVGYRLDAERIKKGELPFLPQILKNRGYATGGAVSAYVLQGKTGLSTGFDFYEDGIEFRTGTGLGGLQRPGGETLRLSLDWLRGVAGKPFFYFFHIYEPHTPYTPPARFASYADKYDGEVAAADAVVGELLAELKRLDVYDKALIVLTSDHGEGLGEHGEDEHGVFLYHEAIHVPLLVKLPESQLAGGTASRPVQLLDVAPTVLSLLGEKVPEPLKGASLLDMLAPEAPVRRIYSETFYPRLHFGWSELSSLIDDRHHYIEGPDPELYDVVRDPREKENILQRERRTYAALRKEIEGYDRDLAPPSAVDEETRQAMTALGYIGGAGAGSGDGPLPDPKTRIASLDDLKNGVQLLGSKSYPEAAEAFRRVIAQNPRMVDAWEFLGRALQRSGRIESALAAYREALEISGGSPHIAVAAASLYFDLEQLDQAEQHARIAVPTNPSFAHGLLAQIALRRGRLDEAEKEARLAMEDESLRVGPMVTLAEVLHARKDLQGALDLTRQAEAVYNEREAKDEDLLRGLYLMRGKVLADLGDARGAEQAFQREIQLFPDSVRAYSSLALLYALTGRSAEVGPTLKRMVDANPHPLAYAEAVKALRVMNDRASASSLLRFALGRYPDSTVLQGLARAG
jgi:arylsulfatase A-like enzyme